MRRMDGEIPAIAPGVDDRFRDLTLRGNAAVREGDRAAAGRLHRAAAREAEALLMRAEEGCAGAMLVAPMALTVAAGNLAALLRQAGDERAAAAAAGQAAERLIATASRAGAPPILRLSCARHLRHALRTLGAFEGEAATWPAQLAGRPAQLAERAAQAAREVIRVATAWRREPTAHAPADGRIALLS